ncbi:hypothetical protein GCM10007907_24570 [Chitinimonas prasina]|uniref:DUF4279 domain-containing protein n=1 Tax=Chitinimonas prasina TaxID=1434937 RepID=A0ABQ5YF98_9NEIS|nr:hypothetical protein [Chitinimonas prasina]GLR13667.1 hypothetical protein GCM10007907_24570 [Chitinimonas prasina]
MHPSYFLNVGMSENDPARELKLPPEVSEWLFFTNYWAHLNQVGEASFAQYEEEVLTSQLIPSAIEALERIKGTLSATPTHDIQFVYGWNERREEIFCTISTSLLLEKVVCLEEFFLAALHMQADIYCQL